MCCCRASLTGGSGFFSSAVARSLDATETRPSAGLIKACGGCFTWIFAILRLLMLRWVGRLIWTSVCCTQEARRPSLDGNHLTSVERRVVTGPHWTLLEAEPLFRLQEPGVLPLLLCAYLSCEWPKLHGRHFRQLGCSCHSKTRCSAIQTVSCSVRQVSV